jgi:hypothetical protein
MYKNANEYLGSPLELSGDSPDFTEKSMFIF